MIGDYLFIALYFPVAMVLALAGMAWDALRRVLGADR